MADTAEALPPPAWLDGLLECLADAPEEIQTFGRLYGSRPTLEPPDSVPDLANEITGLYSFISQRTDSIAVRVFDPVRSVHGYEAEGTVVEVNLEDAPFLVDSITAELRGRNLGVERLMHPVVDVTRDEGGRLTSIGPATTTGSRESVQHLVLDRHLDEDERQRLEEAVRSVVADVRAAVDDFHAMVEATERMVERCDGARAWYPDADVDEAEAFLRWLPHDNFVFLGFREYRIVDGDDGPALMAVPGSGLGILSDVTRSGVAEPTPLTGLPADLAARYEEGDLLVISKTNRRSTVHRRAKMDYVGVRMLGPDGRTVGELRLLGLFTSKAYMEPVVRVPILRRKISAILETEGLIEGSHDHKAVVAVIESFPKDQLWGLPTDDLRRVVMGLLAVQDRTEVRLFVRRDLLDRGVRVLVAMPADRYTAELGRRLGDLLRDRFGGSAVDRHLTLDHSEMARLHFTVWVTEGQVPDVDFAELDAEVMALTRPWSDKVVDRLAQRHGGAEARVLVERWAPRLPAYYTSSTAPEIGAGDIERLEALVEGGHRAVVGLQNETRGPDLLTRVALYERAGKRALSALTPGLEEMGLTVVEEVPTRVAGDDGPFIHDFGVLGPDGAQLDLDRIQPLLTDAIAGIWSGEVESDSLNRLVVAAALDHRQIAVLRAYRTYWRRVAPAFTIGYVNDTLVRHAGIAADLVRLFELKFDPDSDGRGYDDLRGEIKAGVDAIPSLDEDRILRTFLRLVDATLRTNAFRPGRRSLVLKLRSADVPDMPSPQPHVEVFVIADGVEGIHLRAGERSRGGIRWSQRREDYRTEVLGLMKAQTTKNAIIVPTGAKGGFVLRGPLGEDPGGDVVEEAYSTFIGGLLDVTDDIVDGKVVHPPGCRIHDGDDPYLVVAADRGTAGLSDVANAVAATYGFWLDDAFASGGRTGFDHKALGVTARGAWKSLECHLLQRGRDPRRMDFSVVGIGDMSGDVFGNGMLGSETIRLVAAFDHRHVFVDPDPDPRASFRERSRLFLIDGSTWADYDRSLISQGGGVFERDAKTVALSPEAREVLGTEAEVVTGPELVRIVLTAPVDVIWNGGIGTYVKAGSERDVDVGDKANDEVRVDAADLRARIVVEGGNLGLTQRARIEFAEAGGLVNTDFIDNSAGVDCSDREVNLKVLLRLAEERGDIDRPDRNRLLADVAEEVMEDVLSNSLAQARLLARERSRSRGRTDPYEQLMAALEQRGILDRVVEDLPTTRAMASRDGPGGAMTTPELAVLVAHAKRALAESVHASDLPDRKASFSDLVGYFPPTIAARFPHLLWDHPLRRELIATVVANEVVDCQGPAFVSRLATHLGAAEVTVIDAFRLACEVVGGPERRRELNGLLGRIDYDVWIDVMDAADRLVETLTRWFTRHPRRPGDRSGPRSPAAFAALAAEAAEWGPAGWRREREAEVGSLIGAGVPPDLAHWIVAAPQLVHAPAILELATATGRSSVEVARLFVRIGRELRIDDVESSLPSSASLDPWQWWAAETIVDDLLSARQALARTVLTSAGPLALEEALDRFLEERVGPTSQLLEIARVLRSVPPSDPSPFIVAVNRLRALAGG